MMLAGIGPGDDRSGLGDDDLDGLGGGGVVGGVGWGEGDREGIGAGGRDVAGGRGVGEGPATEAVALSCVVESAVP